MQFMIEVLPAPCGPMIENNSPSFTPKLTSVSARTPPKRSDTPRTSKACSTQTLPEGALRALGLPCFTLSGTSTVALVTPPANPGLADFRIRLHRGRMLWPAPRVVQRTGAIWRRSPASRASRARYWSTYGGSGYQTARGAVDRRYRAGRRLSRRISARARLHRAWREAALVLLQHRAHRSSLRGSARRRCAVPAALWRHDGLDQPDPADAADPSHRDL